MNPVNRTSFHSKHTPPGLVGLLLWLAMTAPALAQESPAVPPDPAADDPAAQESPAVPNETQQPAKVTVTLTPEQITVGGRVKAEVTLVWMGGAPTEPARFPTWQDAWGSAEVLNASDVETFEDQSGRYIFKQIVELTAFEVGEVNLPAPLIALPLADETLELSSEASTRFEVVSILPEDPATSETEDGSAPTPTSPTPASPTPGSPSAGAPNPGEEQPAESQALEPKPSAPPIELQYARRAFIISTAVLGALLFVSLIQMLRRLAGQQAIDPSAPQRAPIDPLTLLQPLEELMSRLDRVDPDYLKPAHTGLSYALRRYLSRRLGFPAVESTTTEIQNHLRSLMLPADMGQRTLQMLRDCDMVKFAGISIDDHVTRDRVQLTRDLGQRLEERFRPTVTESEPGQDADAPPSSRSSAEARS